MEATKPFVLRWGIISTGKIAKRFISDLLVHPGTRGVHDVLHKVTAVGSRNLVTAEQFIAEYVGGDKSIKAYGSYTEVYNDQNVDIIFVGTPNSYHYENSLDAIKAKKHVLCEKAVTVNAAEMRSLSLAAKEHGVFFMEALWTRFQPLVKEIKEIGDSGVLGNPVHLQASYSRHWSFHELPMTDRLINPYLAGGVLLDLGPYPVFWALLALYDHPFNNRSKPSQIIGTMLKTPRTGVDQSTSFIVTFAPTSPSPPNTLGVQALLTCSANGATYQTGVVIRYERGVIAVNGPSFRPTSFTVQYYAEDKPGVVVKEETRRTEHVGLAYHYQADEAARCIRDGKLESELWGHEMSVLEMEIFDEVRRQGGLEFPPGVEKQKN